MNSLAAYEMAKFARATGAKTKVFDWNKAAKILKLRDIQNASAGLASDLEYTEGDILKDGKPVSGEAYLLSVWATPLLIIESEKIECWVYEDEAKWEIGEKNGDWPESALKIMEELKNDRS